MSSCFGLLAGKAGQRLRFLTFKQAQEAGGSVRKGERGTKVYFVKQLRVTETKEGENLEKLVPMMREYVVFNVSQCDGLPANIVQGKPARLRNPDTRDVLADEFLAASGAVIREGQGEAYYSPGADFISLPSFAAFRGADHAGRHLLKQLKRPPEKGKIDEREPGDVAPVAPC